MTEPIRATNARVTRLGPDGSLVSEPLSVVSLRTMPVMHGDGIHEDTRALQAMLDGEDWIHATTTIADVARNQSRFSFPTANLDPAFMKMMVGADFCVPTPALSVWAVPNAQQEAIEQIVASLHDDKLRVRIRRQFPAMAYWSIEMPHALLTTAGDADNTTTVSWTATAGATGYNVYGPSRAWFQRKRLAIRVKWWFLRQRGRIYDLLEGDR